MVETRQQTARGLDPTQEQNLPEELRKMFSQMAEGSDPVMGQISQKMGSNAEAMVTLKSRRALNLHPPHSMESNPLKSQEV